MKFVPTSLFSSLVRGASKYLLWRVYVKKTTDLSEVLTTGTWIDVTDRVNIPTLAMSIESSVGSSVSDKISLDGSGIVWWLAQVFNATSAQYIEVKVTCQLGVSELKLATDLCYEFYGYVQKNPKLTESTDTISFEVYSADDILSVIPAENLSKQVKVADLDGAGLEGLYLQTLSGVYVVDANIGGHVLGQGVHTLSFSIRSGIAMLSLDGGVDTTASAGLVTLSDKDDAGRVQVWCNITKFGSADLETEIIVITAATLPRTWLSGIRVKDALATIYAYVGLTSFTFDEWELGSYDGRRVCSFFEVPPSGTFYGRTNCVAYEDSNTTLYLGVKNRLYARSMTTHIYTLLCTPHATLEVKKIFTDRVASDGYIWLWLSDGTTCETCRVTVSDNAVARWSASAACDQAVCYASGIGGASGSLCYWIKAGSYVKKFDLATPAESNLYASPFDTIGIVIDQNGGCSDGTVYYTVGVGIGFPYNISLIGVTAAGDVLLHVLASYDAGWVSIEMGCVGNFILYSSSRVDGCNVYTIPSDTLTLSVATGEVVAPFTKGTNIHFVRRVGTDLFIAKFNMTTIVSETESIRFGTDTIDVGQMLAYDTANNKNIFVSSVGSMLGQFYTTVSAFLSAECSFTGQSMRGALNTILESYMMLGKISPDKTVKVYRRFDAAGVVKTSGSTFAVTLNEAEDIIKEIEYSPAVKWLEVSNGVTTHSYDGTNWDQQLFTSDRKLTLTSKLVPGNIVKDICYYLWQFFSVDHHLYEIPLANVTPLHLEAFDGLAVIFAGNRITESATLAIYGISVDEDGYMKVKGLK